MMSEKDKFIKERDANQGKSKEIERLKIENKELTTKNQNMRAHLKKLMDEKKK
jgi:hypothetical protein